MNNATIDIGNTNIKTEYWTDSGIVRREICPSKDWEKLISGGSLSHMDAIIVSSVRGDSNHLIDNLRQQFGNRLTEFNQEEIRKYYPEILYKGDIGADRIAAALGAEVLYPAIPKMVVDLGTAITIDVVDGNGRFCGGNISLGLGSRMKALANATSQLPEVTGVGGEVEFGFDTFTAIECGALNGVVGEILYSYALAEERYGVEMVLLTGGDAPEVESRVMKKLTGESCPHLVGCGLNYHLRKTKG